MKNLTYLCTMAFALFIITSCSKWRPQYERIDTPFTPKYKWGDAENTKNPYSDDSSGYAHNEGINFLHDEIGNYVDNTAWFYEAKNILDTFYYSGNAPTEFVQGLEVLIADTVANVNLTYLSTFRDSAKATFTTQKGIDYFERLHDTLANTKPGYLTQAIAALEDTIMADTSNLDNDDEWLLFHASDVARYSDMFWKDINTDGEPPFDDVTWKTLAPVFTNGELKQIRGADVDAWLHAANDAIGWRWLDGDIIRYANGQAAGVSFAVGWKIFWGL